MFIQNRLAPVFSRFTCISWFTWKPYETAEVVFLQASRLCCHPCNSVKALSLRTLSVVIVVIWKWKQIRFQVQTVVKHWSFIRDTYVDVYWWWTLFLHMCLVCSVCADCTILIFLDTESSRKLRESFAKACFETLLQFSFVIRSTSASSQDDGAITQIAILSLLDRCKSVLVKFVADERLSGKCPLPRFTASLVMTVLYTGF